MNQEHIAGPSFRIFIVENHPDTLECLSMYLEEIGHTVLSASSMAEALEKIPTSHCEILISDIGLSDGDGWQLLRELGTDQPVYSVAMSGFGRSTDRLKSKSAGFRHHLLKPLTPDHLDELLREVIMEMANDRNSL